MNSSLEAEYYKLTEQIAALQKLVAKYEEDYRLNKHRQFGQSSEKSFYDEHQTLLVFDEAENEADTKKPEPTTEEISAYVRHKRSGTGSKEDDYSSLPVETVVHSMPEAERICPECDGPMHVQQRAGGISDPRAGHLALQPSAARDPVPHRLRGALRFAGVNISGALLS